jgi:hypothetical protein
MCSDAFDAQRHFGMTERFLTQRLDILAAREPL